MRRELQLTIETVEANHRALRRCHGCGNYTRPFVEMDGAVRCERCAKKAERESEEEENLEATVSF